MDYQKHINLLAIGVSVCAGLWGCSLAPSAMNKIENDLQGKLTIHGTSTIEPLVSQIAERFELQNPHVEIRIKTKSSSQGLKDVTKEVVDIGMVARALFPSERKDFKDFTIAREGVGIIVHQDNPIDFLSYEDILNIYTGRIDNWREFGGNNHAIRVVNKTKDNSTQELFLKYFQLDNAQIEVNRVSKNHQKTIEFIASHPDAIGYVSIDIAEYHITHGVPITLLPIEGTAATTAAVRDSSFPLSRPLNLVTKTEPSGLIKEFIEFAQSEKVHDLVRKQYFVPVN